MKLLRKPSAQQSPSSSVNNYSAKRRPAMKTRGKSLLQEEQERKIALLEEEIEEWVKTGKRRKRQTEYVDWNNIVLTDDDMVEIPLDRNDRKLKKQVKFPFSKIEPGQCSQTKTPKPRTPKIKPQKAYCKICMAESLISETFKINPYNHIFCNSCTISYISSKIQENISEISCPDPDCKTVFLDPVLCMEILPKEVFEKWGFLLCESFLGVDEKFYCPFKDCSALLLHEGDEITNSECPHCNRMFCARCKVPWHADLGCDEFKKLRENAKEKELDLLLENLAKDNKWQRCPQCQMYVEKIAGCKFMRCRCGNCFCYVCTTPMNSTTHYCEKCRS